MLGARPGLPQPLIAAYECARPRSKHPPAERVRAWAQSCHSSAADAGLNRRPAAIGRRHLTDEVAMSADLKSRQLITKKLLSKKLAGTLVHLDFGRPQAPSAFRRCPGG
jgi:hypothetical protein